MPSKSKQQQKFMGMVHALQKGDMKPSDASPELKKVAKSMDSKDAKDYASTSHKGLPRKVKQEILNRLKEYANKMGTDHLGGDDYTSSKKGGLRDFDGYDNVDYNKDMPMDEGFKSEYKGNDGIIWKKGKTRGGVTNFTPYYKGHNIDFGGHNFKTEKELKNFIKDYILSNQLYNKYRFESVNERADYKYLTQTLLDAKPKYNVYYNSGHNKVNIGGVGYDGGDLVKNFNQKPGSSSKIKNNFYHADQDPQKTKKEVEKLSKGKIKVDIQKGYGGKPMAVYIMKESVNENLITERQLKGLEGIDNKTPLTKISDAQKLKIIQGTGNNISFKVPKGFNRNFWQVFSKGKIKKKKSLSGDIVYFLPGKIINSPNFKSEKDLINGVDWDAVEQTRRFNESVVNEGVLDIFKNEFKIALNFIKKTFGGSGVKISVKHIRPDIKYTDKYIEVLGPNGNSIRIQVSAYQTGWSEKVPASSALFPDFTDKKYGGSWSVKAYKKDSRDEMDTTKISSKTNQEYSVSIKSNRDAKKWVLGQLTKYISSHKDILKKFITEPISESVNEAKVKRPVNRWLELKNDETMHPHKKMAHGLKELKYQLAETEKFFKWYNKIKNINELESSNYWKRTQNHIYKIKERLVNIARTIQEIEK
jgi:hypothetical protein